MTAVHETFNRSAHTSMIDAEITIARNSYDEAERVTEAYNIQLHKRREYSRTIPDWDQDRRATAQRDIEEAEHQLAAAERAEFSAWSQLNYLRKVRDKELER